MVWHFIYFYWVANIVLTVFTYPHIRYIYTMSIANSVWGGKHEMKREREKRHHWKSNWSLSSLQKILIFLRLLHRFCVRCECLLLSINLWVVKSSELNIVDVNGFYSSISFFHLPSTKTVFRQKNWTEVDKYMFVLFLSVCVVFIQKTLIKANKFQCTLIGIHFYLNFTLSRW